jgi:hypothetical protein
LGIYARPEHYELAGDCLIRTQQGELDLSASGRYGLALPSTLMDSITEIEMSSINCITFIENKTNYDEYIASEKQSGELVIYHGGFLSPQKRRLFALIANGADAKPNVRFWADIDKGGFQMFLQLRELIPAVVPMRMSGEFVDKFHEHGLARSKEYLVALQTDLKNGKYLLFQDAIEKILIPFYYDPKIKAVGGTVKVRNAEDSLCTSMQALEYLKTIQVGRMVTNALGIYHIISGAFGAFEKEKLIQIGMWDIGPGLDGDITQKIRKSGDKVYFAEDAICMTNVPTTWHALFKQRQRWSKSLIRFRLRKHFDILMPHKHFSILNWISNMENLLYDCFFNFMWFFYILTLIFMHTDRLMEIFIVGWMIRYCFSLVAFGVIMMISERASEEKKLVPYLFFSTFYTGYFLRLTRLLAHTKELFFFSSYKDPWNPKKTSDLAQIEGI